MRFGMVHRLMTNALAALGVIALVASGQFDRWVSGLILVGLAAALMVRESWQRHPAMRHLDSGALLAVAAVQVFRVIFDASLLEVLIEFAAALQIIRLATRKGAAHDQQVIVLSLLHLIAGTVLGGGLAYGLCFVGVLVVAPGALVLSHLRREVEGNYRQGARDRTGLPVDVPRILRSRRVVGRTFLAVTCLLSIPIFLFTAALFVVFPRVGLSLLLLNRGQNGRMIGFSSRVDLGQVGTLRENTTMAMRIEIPDQPQPPPKRLTLHLRGTALDAYDGRVWSQSGDHTRPNAETANGLVLVGDTVADPAHDRIMNIDLEPFEPPIIFVPQGARGLRLRGRGKMGNELSGASMGPEGELRYGGLDDRGLSYQVYYRDDRRTPARRLHESERARYLQIPSDMPARVGELARQWTDGLEAPRDKARAIREHLRDGTYRYSLNTDSGNDEHPLDHFLFESKKGHCEFYSTAMAVMLRTVDVPSRNVTGFLGGTHNRFGGFYAVRQGDAHSWVEAYIDGEGWVTYDPTPSAVQNPAFEIGEDTVTGFLRDLFEATSQRWDRHVEGYDLDQQMHLFQSVTDKYGSPTSRWSRWSSRRVLAMTGGVTLLLGAIAYRLLKRRRKATPRPAAAGKRSPSAVVAIALYESLELAMSAQGISRAPGVPPLKHAETLIAAGHPLGDEILALTRTYLAARFGGEELDEAARKQSERRIRAIKDADLKEELHAPAGTAA